MNLALRDVRHNLFRFFLTCLGLGLLMTVVLAMMGIYNGLVSDALNIVKARQADIWVVEADTKGPFAEASKVPNETRDAVARLAVCSICERGYLWIKGSDNDKYTLCRKMDHSWRCRYIRGASRLFRRSGPFRQRGCTGSGL